MIDEEGDEGGRIGEHLSSFRITFHRTSVFRYDLTCIIIKCCSVNTWIIPLMDDPLGRERRPPGRLRGLRLIKLKLINSISWPCLIVGLFPSELRPDVLIPPQPI